MTLIIQDIILQKEMILLEKNVNVYNENGDLLTSFSSAIEASDYYKISKSVIYQCCGRFTMYSL